MATPPKILVVSYSLEGNTAFIAETLAATMQADRLALQPQQAIAATGVSRFFWGGMQVVLKRQPELLPFDKDPAQYDVIVLGTPVWASNYAPPLRTFLATTPLHGKCIALFCCYGGSAGKTFDQLKQACAGNTILGEMGFRNPLKDKAEALRQAQTWAQTMLAKM